MIEYGKEETQLSILRCGDRDWRVLKNELHQMWRELVVCRSKREAETWISGHLAARKEQPK